jgi:arylsulfatase A-like enzyme/Flp pilus assembly protein TadD
VAAALVALGVVASGCGRASEPAAPAVPGAGAKSAAARPDLVLVTIDTLRADALGFAGNRDVETPRLDRLAAGGLVFRDAHAHNVVTLPSHANILTGLYPFQHGIRDNSGFKLDPAIPTLATEMAAAGYATGAFVGAYPLDRRYGLGDGFAVYDDDYPLGAEGATFTIAERRGDAVVAAALAWWKTQAGRPRFLWVHLYDPHASYAPPEPFASRYRDRPYLGEVAATDAFLAPLLEPHLDGREPPALVVVTADHGEALGEHGEQTHGLFAYEATLKVPLVVWGAGVAAGVDDRAARHIDIAPTMLAAAGVPPARRLPGHSLLAPPVAADSYFEAMSTALNRGWAPLRGLLRERRKYIDLPLPELYALPTDPHERDNLVERDRPAARDLRAAIPAESAWSPAGRQEATSEEVAQLRSLGYAVGSAEPRSSFGPDDDPKRLIEVDRRLHEIVDLYSRGDLAGAVAAGQALIRDRPETSEAYDHTALALRALERHDEAIATLEAGMARAAVNASIARQLGMALAEVGRAREAVAVLSPLAERDDADLLRALGSALTDSGDPARGLEILARAARLAPGDPRVLEAQGVAELRRDRPAEARALLEQALARSPGLATAWNTLGVALYRLEGPRAALAAWQQAVAHDPSLWDAQYNLGLVALAVGERDVARRALGQFVAGAPPARYAPDLAKARAALRQAGG